MQNKIVIYKGQKSKINVSLDVKHDTVWLNRQQIADLFGRDVKTVGKHVNNALDEELKGIPVVAKFATTATDNKTYQVEYYNLDMILSVGYRVKSPEGVKFRKWANSVLKSHIIQGYSINQRRLEQLNQMLEIVSRSDIAEVAGVAGIVQNYLGALDLLEAYDEDRLKSPKGQKPKWELTHDEAIKFIRGLPFYETSTNFGRERSDSFKGIVAGLYQTFGGVDLYESTEEKAANLLYQVVKDHPFFDGNKRSAAALFVYFLGKNGLRYVESSTLAAMTLMVALSKPAEKDTMVKLVMNLLDLSPRSKNE
jgi:death-on-curing family protein